MQAKRGWTAVGVVVAAAAVLPCRRGEAGVVAEARRRLEPLEPRFIPAAVSTAVAGVARSATMPTFGKVPLHGAIVANRWDGMESLETLGADLIRSASGPGEVPSRIAGAVARLLTAAGISAGETARPPPISDRVGPDDLERIVGAAAVDLAPWPHAGAFSVLLLTLLVLVYLVCSPIGLASRAGPGAPFGWAVAAVLLAAGGALAWVRRAGRRTAPPAAGPPAP